MANKHIIKTLKKKASVLAQPKLIFLFSLICCHILQFDNITFTRTICVSWRAHNKIVISVFRYVAQIRPFRGALKSKFKAQHNGVLQCSI